MAKPTTNAIPICIALTVFFLLGTFVSLITRDALWLLLTLLPTVGYEVYRTEAGASTKYSSIFLFAVITLEIIFLVFNVNFDLAKFLETEETYIAGYTLPLGDIKVFGPILSAILAILLFFRTYGPYTKYLSVVIAVGSFIAVYIINPLFFTELIRLVASALFDRLPYML